MNCPKCGGAVASIEGRGIEGQGAFGGYAHAYHCVNGHEWPAQSKPFFEAVLEAAK